MKQAYLVAGLAFGDEGKGATVDYLVRQSGAGLVVRYNGGSQAAHNVVTSDGRHHTFAQFGSGSFVPGVKTHLSQHMLVNPMSMHNEAAYLRTQGLADVEARTTVAEGALIITPFHRALNRLLEWSRGQNRHGSCGAGVGQTRELALRYGSQVLYAGDLHDEKITEEKLRFVQSKCWARVQEIKRSMFKTPEVEKELTILSDEDAVDWCGWMHYRHHPLNVVGNDYLRDALKENDAVVFEGAQGVLLDETFGYKPPYTTWTDTTFRNADELLNGAGFGGRVTRVGVLRSYFTRHGAGPFPTEVESLSYPEPHNGTGEFQGKFRFGLFDNALVEYALSVCGGVDMVALNHLDQVENEELLEKTVALTFAPVGIRGFGPRAEDRRTDGRYSYYGTKENRAGRESGGESKSSGRDVTTGTDEQHYPANPAGDAGHGHQPETGGNQQLQSGLAGVV